SHEGCDGARGLARCPATREQDQSDRERDASEPCKNRQSERGKSQEHSFENPEIRSFRRTVLLRTVLRDDDACLLQASRRLRIVWTELESFGEASGGLRQITGFGRGRLPASQIGQPSIETQVGVDHVAIGCRFCFTNGRTKLLFVD